MRRTPMPDPLSEVRGERWPVGQAIAIYLAAFAAMTWPWLSGQAAIPWDAKAHFLPQIQFLAASLARGELPWWNPYVFSGSPQIADPQSMIFSPPYLLLALFNGRPGPWAQDVTLLAAMAAGGVGLILWFRDMGWHWAGGVVAALVFTFGAAMAWRLQHTGQVLSLAYLPWALLFLDRAVERGALVAGIAAGAISAAMVLGRDQVALLCCYLLAGRVVWLWLAAPDPRRRIVGSLAPLTLAALTGLAIVTVPVLMTVLLAEQSNRPTIDFAGAGAGSLHPAHLVTLAVPQLFGAAGDMADYWGPPSFAWVGTGLFTAQNVGQLYIGLVPLVLVLAGAVGGRLFDREVRFFTAAFVLVLLYALGWYTPAFRVMYELPGINLYRRPADAVFLIGGLGAILAGYVVHAWFREPWALPRRPALAVVISLPIIAGLAAVGFGLHVDRLPRVAGPAGVALIWYVVAIGALLFAASRVALSPQVAALALVAATAADLGFNNGPSTSSALPPATFEALEPSGGNATIRALEARVVKDGARRDRVELAGLGFHWPNASMTHGLENTLGYNPVRLGLYSRATGAEDHVGLPDQRKFSALFPSYRSRLADLLGLRWIVTSVPVESMDKALRPGDLVLRQTTDQANIYENPRALPRVLFASRALSADFERILANGVWPDFDPMRTVLLAKGDTGAARREGTARLVAYGNNRVEIDVEAPDGGFAVLNDVWHPWWRATLDGRPVPIERANVLFRAVAVPAGRHRIVMTFEPLAGMIDDLRARGRRPPTAVTR